jgi:integrase
VELPKAPRRQIKPLTDGEIPLFLETIDNHPYSNAYALCLFAGLREAECMGLSWNQIDFKRKTITVCQQLQKNKTGNRDYFIADTTKSGKPRTIKPPAIAFEYLIDEQSKQISNRLRAGKAWSNPHNLVFTDEIGGHYAVGTFYKRFKRIAESIGRPDARPHDLRHSCATVALASGADIKSVQSLLGHATASFTLDVYGHTSEKMMQDTANRMQNYYNTLANNG